MASFLFSLIVLFSILLELASAFIAVPLIFAFLGNMDLLPFKLSFFGGVSDQDSILVFGALLVISYGVLSVFRAAALAESLEIGRLITKNANEILFNRILFGQVRKIRQLDSSQMVTSILARSSSLGIACSRVLALFSFIVIVIVVSCFLFWYQPPVFLYMCCLAATIGLFLSLITRNRLGVDSQAINKISQQLVLTIKETISGVREIRTSSIEPRAFAQFNALNTRLRNSQKRVQFYAALPRIIVEGLGICSLLLAVGGMTLINSNRDVAIADAGVFIVVSLRVLPLLQQIFATILEIRGLQAMAEECADDLSDQSIRLVQRPSSSQSCNEDYRFDEIRLRNVSRTFSEEGGPILKELDLTIRYGDKIAVVGESGSGKSTFLELLSLLDQPDTGSIFMTKDGEKNLFFNDLIYFVPQQSLIFNDLH